VIGNQEMSSSVSEKRSWWMRPKLLAGVGLTAMAVVSGIQSTHVSANKGQSKTPSPRAFMLHNEKFMVLPTERVNVANRKLSATASAMLIKRSSNRVDLPILLPTSVDAGIRIENGLHMHLDITGKIVDVHFSLPQYKAVTVNMDTDVELRGCHSNKRVVSGEAATHGLTVQTRIPGKHGGNEIPMPLTYVDDESRVVECEGFRVGRTEFPQSMDARMAQDLEDLFGHSENEKSATLLTFSVPG